MIEGGEGVGIKSLPFFLTPKQEKETHKRMY